MAVTQILTGVWQINLGPVNAFLVADEGGLSLIDTGTPGSAPKIIRGLESIGSKPADIKRIIVTHCHPDHSGSAAVMKSLTGALVIMHSVDADMVRRGEAMRRMSPAPGLRNRLLFRLFVPSPPSKIDACAIDREVDDGMEVTAGGLRVVHAPGHCSGQIVLLCQRRRVLFAADAASNMFGLGLSLGYEDLQLGTRTLSRLASLDFGAACFGHGRAITEDAAVQFRRKWGGATHS